MISPIGKNTGKNYQLVKGQKNTVFNKNNNFRSDNQTNISFGNTLSAVTSKLPDGVSALGVLFRRVKVKPLDNGNFSYNIKLLTPRGIRKQIIADTSGNIFEINTFEAQTLLETKKFDILTGHLRSQTIYNPSLFYKNIIVHREFDVNTGSIVRATTLDAYQRVQNISIYNAQGEEIEARSFGKNGLVKYLNRYQNGKRIEIRQYRDEGGIENIKRYNDEGTLIEKISYNENGSKEYTDNYDKGLLRTRALYNPDGTTKSVKFPEDPEEL